jgi:DNA polymerase V
MKHENKVFALVDVNNCYVSCERMFNPRLIDKPVIVLSNNDGCAVARSNKQRR